MQSSWLPLKRLTKVTAILQRKKLGTEDVCYVSPTRGHPTTKDLNVESMTTQSSHFIPLPDMLMLKILQARLQQYVNCELPDVQAGFRKGRGTRDQIANIRWMTENQESSRKTSISALLTMPKPLTVWITINCGKF